MIELYNLSLKTPEYVIGETPEIVLIIENFPGPGARDRSLRARGYVSEFTLISAVSEHQWSKRIDMSCRRGRRRSRLSFHMNAPLQQARSALSARCALAATPDVSEPFHQCRSVCVSVVKMDRVVLPTMDGHCQPAAGASGEATADYGSTENNRLEARPLLHWTVLPC